MNIVDLFSERNEAFAGTGFSADLKIMPSMKTIVLGCVDSRVDPVDIFGLNPGEAVVIRNVGGRITEDVLTTVSVLRAVAQVAGKDVGAGWNLVVLHHTDCGIVGCYRHAPDLLAKYLGVSREKMETLAVTDPYEAVGIDVATLKASPELPSELTVSGLVYDVATGRFDTVVAAAALRQETVD